MKRIVVQTLATFAVLLPCSLAAPQVRISGPLRKVIMRVSNRPANVKGRVFVLMYHRVGPKEKYMIRSYDNFLKDLTTLKKMGFRPVTITEYATNTMNLPPGASPVVLTFDDSWDCQFNFLKDGRLDPTCFVAIWKKFAEQNPDFPIKGTFYCLKNGPFGNEKDAPKKLKMLTEWGSEIASHTLHHANLGKISQARAMKEIGGSYEYLKGLGYTPRAFAPPYGIWPHDGKLVKKFKYGKETVTFDSAVEASASPAPSPLSSKFNRYRIPRVQAYPGNMGIDWWLNEVTQKRIQVYVEP